MKARKTTFQSRSNLRLQIRTQNQILSFEGLISWVDIVQAMFIDVEIQKSVSGSSIFWRNT